MEVFEYLTWANFMNILCAWKETLVNFIFNFFKHFKILFETGHEYHNYIYDSIYDIGWYMIAFGTDLVMYIKLQCIYCNHSLNKKLVHMYYKYPY